MADIRLQVIGSYETGVFDESAAEIPAYDPATQRLFVVNANDAVVEVLDLSDPTQPSKLFDIQSDGGIVNSVAVSNGIVAIAVENEDTQAPGTVEFYAADGDGTSPLSTVTAGALPDMLVFTPDGTKVLVANEGEPNDDYTIDPEGSISIIDISGGVENLTQANVTTADFNAFDAQIDALRDSGVRIFGPNASVSQDLEPEYIAVSPDSTTAWVALQENNALAVVNIPDSTVTAIVPLGFKDHSIEGNGLDPSDRDDGINITTHPVLGMYQPDAIATYSAGGETYIVTANEGDARDYDGFSEESRISRLALDATAFPNAAALQDNAVLGRLTVTTTLGNTDGDDEFEQLYAFGTRSFSIWNDQGQLIYDSGDDFEQITAEQFPEDFNANNDENDSFESRSDNKGPEPEGVAVGTINGRTYAFIGLERIGGIMVYDVTDPNAVDFVKYINPRDFSGDAAAGTAGPLGPEGLIFIDAQDSPNGEALLVVSNEVSGSTTVFSIDFNLRDFATPGRDVLRGTSQRDVVNALAGNDIVFGLGGNDVILGADGNDRLFGGDGDDRLVGGDGNDVLVGDDGNDRLVGGAGDDVLLGRNGNDILLGGPGNDRLVGGIGDDLQRGGAGDDIMIGNAGNDRLLGDSGSDRLFGGVGNDELFGGAGNDRLLGQGGNDALVGNAGNDILIGGAGNDVLNGGLGNDRLIGQAGRDIFVISRGGGRDIAVDFQDGVDRIGLSGRLEFGDLTILDAGRNTVIRDGRNPLLVMRGVDADDINRRDFVAV